jgi:hypothetical protein
MGCRNFSKVATQKTGENSARVGATPRNTPKNPLARRRPHMQREPPAEEAVYIGSSQLEPGACARCAAWERRRHVTSRPPPGRSHESFPATKPNAPSAWALSLSLLSHNINLRLSLCPPALSPLCACDSLRLDARWFPGFLLSSSSLFPLPRFCSTSSAIRS